ncbi:MAG TPA: peptidylprolyl isomerase, partial [Isosphaeraceae bacterium]|nr:peptidylprolyl isomerase [Isosphaeraceae bacterium]
MPLGRFMNSITLLSFLILGLGVCMSLSAVAAQGEGQKPVVVLDTSAGPITVQLDPEKAPITVENFLKYVDEGFYDNLIFHRVMSGFMVQGGGMTDQMEEKSTGKHAPIKNESKGGFDLRLISSLNDASGIPTEGKNLIIVAAVNHVLHFRIFDGDGKVVEDTDERLTEKARQIEDLRKQLESLWPPHELTASEKGRVITAVTSIVGHTPKGGLSNLRGTIAMARTNNPDSATCQF